MSELKIDAAIRPYHLEKFCGDKLIQFTGVTYILTGKGRELIEMGDTIVKDEKGNLSLVKSATP